MPPKRRPRKGTLAYALDSCDRAELTNIVSKKCHLDGNALVKVMECLKNSREMYGVHMSPLQGAVMLGQYDICKQLIEEGAVLKKTVFSYTPDPLCLALQGGHFDIACLLIKAGADLTLKLENALPMFYALQNSSCPVKVVKDMIAAGFSPNETIYYSLRQTPLHIAVYNSCTSVVKYLLSIPVDLHKLDKTGRSALHYAVQRKNHKMVKLLVKSGANVDIECKKGYTPLFYAISDDNREMAELLISLGADVHYINGDQQSSVMPLHYAAEMCKFKMCRLLIHKGADVNKVSSLSGESALHFACKANHRDISAVKVALDCIVEFFIQEGADLEARQNSGSTPLQVAVTAKNTSLAKILIMNGASINNFSPPEDNRETTIHVVSRGFDKDLIKFCLDYGGDYMAQDKSGMYPCSHVLIKFIMELVFPFAEKHRLSDLLATFKLFWKQGFPFEEALSKKWLKKRRVDYPPTVAPLMKKQEMLFEGVKKCDTEIVKKSIDLGAEVKCCSIDIPKPLHYLALKGSDQIMKEFVSRGVIVNYLNEMGETPIHIAARCGHIECCKVLLENGAVYNHCDNAHLTPLQVAKINGHSEIVKYFKKVDSYFKALKKGNLKKLSTGMKISRAVMNCCHRDGMTLMGRAISLNMKDSADHLMQLRLKITS